MVILENIDIDKAILQNIDIDKISNRFKFGISNRASVQSILKWSIEGKNIEEKNWQILKSIDKYLQILENQHLFPISSELTMEMENIERSQLWREQLQKTGFMILIPIWRISISSRWQFQHKRFLLFKQTITVKREVCSNTNGKHQFLKFA